MAVSICAETLLCTETATVNRENAAKSGSMRTGEAVCAVQSTAKHRLQEAERWWEERIDTVCSWEKRSEKAVPHCH